jgi:hypothetical protein
MLGLLTLWLAAGLATAMTPARIAELRQETIEIFYHGFDNYMNVAFPEDEVGFSNLLNVPNGLAHYLGYRILRIVFRS